MTGQGTHGPVLFVDDDPNLLRSMESLLVKAGLEGVPFSSGQDALDALDSLHPSLILLDISMPGMDGYEVCRQIRSREELAEVPVVFVTARSAERDKQRAFAVGASGYIQKPFAPVPFLTAIRGYLDGTHTLVVLPSTEIGGGSSPGVGGIPAFSEFTDWLQAEFPELTDRETPPPPGAGDLYEWSRMVGLSGEKLARRIAEFTGLPFLHRIQGEDLELGMLPRRFSLTRLVLPVRSRGGRMGVVVSNPFDWELWDALEHTPLRGSGPEILIAAPEAIRGVFDYTPAGEGAKSPGGVGESSGSTEPAGDGRLSRRETSLSGDGTSSIIRPSVAGESLSRDRDPGKDHPVARLAEAVLGTAVRERASDIHIEPKPNQTLIRGRVDGDMVELEEVPNEVAGMLVSRFKALAGMDIAEKRKPQDGGMERKIDGRPFKLRLATSSTPHGESLVIRLLEPTAEPKTLQELGMTPGQEEILQELANRSQGLILLVGPTGSGKSTTIYSLLTLIDTRTRSLMSVEDPVEYRIAFANQQQVNESAGVTFESLLRSAVRQDPDILLLGEMRDLFSAKASMDFASSGHLTITTMHSSNATTAIFRLERLGASRIDMSEALIGVVAQKLIKRLCEKCKSVRAITPEERELLAPFTRDIPQRVGEAVGCPACRGTGFFGREGVFEVLRFDAALAERVRAGVPISELRKFARDRGDFFISDHGLEKIRQLVAPVSMVYESVLVEESVPAAMAAVSSTLPGEEEVGAETSLQAEASEGSPAETGAPEEPGGAQTPAEAAPESESPHPPRVLVVDDDPDIRMLLERFLTGAGFQVEMEEDGVGALLRLGNSGIDLILSDINMPNLDGLKLIEIVNQHGAKAPVVFLSAERDPAVELEGLELGAADFIHKPIQKDVLLHRIRRVLDRQE